MKRARAALALALAALAVFVALVRPARAQLEALRVSELRLRAERREARAELMRLERARPRRAGAAQPVGADEGRLLRRRVLRVLAGAPVRGVVLEIQASEPTARPVARLTAEGAYADVVALAGRLTAREAGLALEQVRLTQVTDGVRLDAVGAAWSAQP